MRPSNISIWGFIKLYKLINELYRYRYNIFSHVKQMFLKLEIGLTPLFSPIASLCFHERMTMLLVL